MSKKKKVHHHDDKLIKQVLREKENAKAYFGIKKGDAISSFINALILIKKLPTYSASDIVDLSGLPVVKIESLQKTKFIRIQYIMAESLLLRFLMILNCLPQTN